MGEDYCYIIENKHFKQKRNLECKGTNKLIIIRKLKKQTQKNINKAKLLFKINNGPDINTLFFFAQNVRDHSVHQLIPFQKI